MNEPPLFARLRLDDCVAGSASTAGFLDDRGDDRVEEDSEHEPDEDEHDHTETDAEDLPDAHQMVFPPCLCPRLAL